MGDSRATTAMADNPDDRDIGPRWARLPALAAAIIAVWTGSGVLVWRFTSSPGMFGDSFGAVNALFSGLAFAGVIRAIFLQRRELKLQRVELELTREELRGQKEQLRAQNETLQLQNFENTFFQLLRLHNDIVNSIEVRHPGGSTTSGRDCFHTFYGRLRERWNKAPPAEINLNDVARIKKAYLAFYLDYEAQLGHYFRSLYNIFKFVDASSLENRRFYTNLVRAQLSTYELALLFYNCVSDLGAEKFRPLIERYGLLKMTARHELLNPDVHAGIYGPEAYGRAIAAPSAR